VPHMEVVVSAQAEAGILDLHLAPTRMGEEITGGYL
jgi:hypothetical protein